MLQPLVLIEIWLIPPNLQPLLTNPICSLWNSTQSRPIYSHTFPIPSALERIQTKPIHRTDSLVQSHLLSKDQWSSWPTRGHSLKNFAQSHPFPQTLMSNPELSWRNFHQSCSHLYGLSNPTHSTGTILKLILLQSPTLSNPFNSPYIFDQSCTLLKEFWPIFPI